VARTIHIQDSIAFALLPNGRSARLLEPFRAWIDDHVIVVPAGFETDFASVPRIFWRVIPPWGRYARAAIVHDYLYASHIVGRKEADKIFLALMRALGVPWRTRTTMYWAVRLGGGRAWEKAKKS